VGAGRADRRRRLMARKGRWYDAIPEASATVDCGGAQHRVTWRRGKLVLEAHDLTAERTMLVFGGELCQCMRVLEMWIEQFRMPTDLFLSMPSWIGENAFLVPDELALPRRLAMVLSWERAWRFASWLASRQAELLAAELKEKALAPLRQHVNAWKAKTGARVVAGCQVTMIPSVRTPAVTGSTDRVALRAVAELAPRWVVDVWPRGIAVVDDAFVVALEEQVTVDDLRVTAFRWEPTSAGTWAPVGAPARVRRTEPDGGWQLEWEDPASSDAPARPRPAPAPSVMRSTRIPGWGSK